MSLEPCSCSQIPQEWDNEQLITGLNEEMDSAMYKGTCLSSPFCMHQMLSTHFDLCHTEAHCPYIKGGAGQKVAKSLFLWSDKAGFEMGAGRNSTQPLSRSIRPSSMGCRSSMLSKGMVNDRRGSHLSKRKWPQFSPTIILSLSIQGFQTTSHCHWWKREKTNWQKQSPAPRRGKEHWWTEENMPGTELKSIIVHSRREGSYFVLKSCPSPMEWAEAVVTAPWTETGGAGGYVLTCP